MEERLGKLEQHLDLLKDSFLKLSGLLEKTLVIIQDNSERVEKRLETIENQLNDLKGNSDHTIVSLETGFNEIKAEIKKINEVTSYESILNNTIGLSGKSNMA